MQPKQKLVLSLAAAVVQIFANDDDEHLAPCIHEEGNADFLVGSINARRGPKERIWERFQSLTQWIFNCALTPIFSSNSEQRALLQTPCKQFERFVHESWPAITRMDTQVRPAGKFELKIADFQCRREGLYGHMWLCN